MDTALLQFMGGGLAAGVAGGIASAAATVRWLRSRRICAFRSDGCIEPIPWREMLARKAPRAAAEPDGRPAAFGGVELPTFFGPAAPAGRTGRGDTRYVTGRFLYERGCIYFNGYLEAPPGGSVDWVRLQRKGRWRVLPADHPYRVAFDEALRRPEGDPLRLAWERTQGVPPTAASRLWEWQDAPADDRAA